MERVCKILLSFRGKRAREEYLAKELQPHLELVLILSFTLVFVVDVSFDVCACATEFNLHAIDAAAKKGWSIINQQGLLLFSY